MGKWLNGKDSLIAMRMETLELEMEKSYLHQNQLQLHPNLEEDLWLKEILCQKLHIRSRFILYHLSECLVNWCSTKWHITAWNVHIRKTEITISNLNWNTLNSLPSIQLQTLWIASKSNSANLVQFKRKLHPLALFTFLSSFFIPERSIASIALSKASWAWGMRHNSKRHLHCRIYNLYTMWVGYPASKARSISVRQSW